ncbi:MAG: hypothetical protein ACK4NO_06105 [Glycocaulis sp.]
MDQNPLASRVSTASWIPDGVYTVRFRSLVDQSGGVVWVNNGRAIGGDSSYYYDGHVGHDETGPVARMLFVRHRADAVSVIGDVERFSVVFSGQVEADRYLLEGRKSDELRMKLSAVMTRLPIQP